MKRKVLGAINDKIGSELRPDMLLNCGIVLKGKMTFSPRYGFEVELLELDPAITQGLIAIREQTIVARLKNDGIFDNQRQLGRPLISSKSVLLRRPAPPVSTTSRPSSSAGRRPVS
jgi:hypothetical protein